MRMFKVDGKSWIAQVHDRLDHNGQVEVRGSWEVVQFDTQPPGNVLRVTYRPAGWLTQATIRDLIEALREGDAVRANWSETN